jgi:alkylation response protein AidB-like acyl-CoA dehydrogenase
MLVTLASATPAGPCATTVLSHPAVDIASGLELAARLGDAGAAPGRGGTRDLWEALATVAATDLGAVRAMEPHLDAVAILLEARVDVPSGSGGVFAAEGRAPLQATEGPGGWQLDGTKPWCSLADRLDWALITATTPDGTRQLFLVELRQPGVTVEPGTWVARGLVEVPSGPVHFDGVPAVAVGAAGWYLERPGFVWGGIGVAACWYGGAVGIARTVLAAAKDKPNPHLLAHLGAIDELLHSCRLALAEAARLVDEGEADRLLAKRVRATVARACEEIINRAGHALGPAPLALDAAHAKRVADLQLYVRQHHAERDQESLGTAVAAEVAPW